MAMHFNFIAIITVAQGTTLLADLALKSAMVLLSAWGLTLLLHRASAALRHLLWTLAAGATLALPLLSAMLPAWHVLPAWMNPSPVPTFTSPTARVANINERPVTVTPPGESEVGESSQGESSLVVRQPPVQARNVVSAPPMAVVPAPQLHDAPLPRPIAWRAVALMVWALGAAIMLVPLVLSLGGLWRLGRRMAPIEEDAWGILLRESAAKLKLHRRIDLLRGCRAGMPMTWGIVRPRLLLPPQADRWPVDRRRIVLMHEMAHIRRGDFLTQLIVHVARALYWFNPLIWIAARQAAIESEQACDDLVLTHQNKASDYAEHLLTLAAGLKDGALLPMAAIAMARSSRLEGRLLAILDARRNRRAVPIAGIIVATTLFAGAILPLAILRAADKNSGAQPPVPQSNPVVDPAKPDPASTLTNAHRDLLKARLEQARAEAAVQERQFRAGLIDTLSFQEATGKVQLLEAELTGDPVKVAEVKLLVARHRLEIVQKYFAAGLNGPLDLTKSKGDVAVAEAELREVRVRTGRAGGMVRFRAIVTDSRTGAPVPNVQMADYKHPGTEGKSDAAGRISIELAAPGKTSFYVQASGYARWWSQQALQPHQRKDEGDSFHRNYDDLEFDAAADMPPVKIELEREVRITGVVQDPDGNPVADATVAPADGTGNSLTGDTRYSVATAKDGTFTILLPASGKAKYNLEAHDGHHQQWRRWANGVLPPIQTQPGDELKDVVIKLTRPATVRGHVSDEAGKPLAGRDVRASAADLLENRYYDPTTKTDKNGNFELRFIRPGDQFIQVAPFFWCNVPADGMTLELKEGQTNSLKVALVEGQTRTGLALTGPASTKFPSNEEQIRRLIQRSQRKAEKKGKAAERAAALKTDVKNFKLDLQYNGAQDKPFYRLRLAVAPVAPGAGGDAFDLHAQITEDQARKIIDHLAADGFLDAAHSLHDWQFIPRAGEPGYSVTVGDYYNDLGWNLKMLAALDGLRTVLEDDAAKKMDLLLGRLTGLRKLWSEKARAQDHKDSAPKPGAENHPDLANLKGEWKITSVEGDDTFRWQKISVGDAIHIESVSTIMGGYLVGARDYYVIAPLKNPKEMDVTFWVDNLFITQHGIYKLDGDVLTLCLAAYTTNLVPISEMRPSKFEAASTRSGEANAVKTTLIVLNRTAARPE